MKPTVYIETTIIGYLAMRPSRDLLVAANQQLTHDWWDNHRHKYEPFISPFVIDECAKGDPTMHRNGTHSLINFSSSIFRPKLSH